MVLQEKIDRSFLQRLRLETHDAHIATENAVDVLRSAATKEAYRDLLTRFYGLHKAFEALFAVSALANRADLELAKRRKCGWIEQDLSALGLAGDDIATIPHCEDLPRVADIAQECGALYVLEGATLGGQLIARHLQENLGIGPANGGRFFNGYQVETGAMWRKFGDIACDILRTPVCQDRAIEAARQTFGVFGDWMTKKRTA